VIEAAAAAAEDEDEEDDEDEDEDLPLSKTVGENNIYVLFATRAEVQ